MRNVYRISLLAIFSLPTGLLADLSLVECPDPTDTTTQYSPEQALFLDVMESDSDLVCDFCLYGGELVPEQVDGVLQYKVGDFAIPWILHPNTEFDELLYRDDQESEAFKYFEVFSPLSTERLTGGNLDAWEFGDEMAFVEYGGREEFSLTGGQQIDVYKKSILPWITIVSSGDLEEHTNLVLRDRRIYQDYDIQGFTESDPLESFTCLGYALASASISTTAPDSSTWDEQDGGSDTWDMSDQGASDENDENFSEVQDNEVQQNDQSSVDNTINEDNAPAQDVWGDMNGAGSSDNNIITGSETNTVDMQLSWDISLNSAGPAPAEPAVVTSQQTATQSWPEHIILWFFALVIAGSVVYFRRKLL